MIVIGLDDTDMPDTPGTVQLARHLAQELADVVRTDLITRHQLCEDARIPCTRRNGCVALLCEPTPAFELRAFVERLHVRIRAWAPPGSDPGCCVAYEPIPAEIVEFGRRCQREMVEQAEARALAAQYGIPLEGLGGTEGGVIGALAASGLLATRDDGRVIYVGRSTIDHYDIGGTQDVARMTEFGIDEVRNLNDRTPITGGTIDVGKRLRPNLRGGRIVLFATSSQVDGVDWFAERLT
ncbi:MAG: hypothetical protein QM811_30715 [Pirellulales bacterium]